MTLGQLTETGQDMLVAYWSLSKIHGQINIKLSQYLNAICQQHSLPRGRGVSSVNRHQDFQFFCGRSYLLRNECIKLRWLDAIKHSIRLVSGFPSPSPPRSYNFVLLPMHVYQREQNILCRQRPVPWIL